MITINIKPLSVNQAWGGRTFKSAAYKKYTKEVPLLLPTELQLPPGKLVLLFKWYFSSVASDIDNPIKPMQDLICDYYQVDDKHIYLAMQEKKLVKRGKERVEFEFLAYSPGMFDLCRDVIINN